MEIEQITADLARSPPMLRSEITPGTEYGLREKRDPNALLQRVRILEHARGKWKAEWVEPNPGLVDYVESVHILCRWKDHKAFLKEEAEAQRLRKHNEEIGYDLRSPMNTAVEQVFEHSCIGDDLSFYKGVLSGSPEALERVSNNEQASPRCRCRGSLTRAAREKFIFLLTTPWSLRRNSAARSQRLFW